MSPEELHRLHDAVVDSFSFSSNRLAIAGSLVSGTRFSLEVGGLLEVRAVDLVLKSIILDVEIASEWPRVAEMLAWLRFSDEPNRAAENTRALDREYELVRARHPSARLIEVSPSYGLRLVALFDGDLGLNVQ
jgi:hypothetical protein